jgi:hypothetical protein
MKLRFCVVQDDDFGLPVWVENEDPPQAVREAAEVPPGEGMLQYEGVWWKWQTVEP